MTVGVIITVYNLEKYVAEAIDSVLAQSLYPNRILVVNDGSSDNSLGIINKYKDKVEIIDQQNQGVLPSVITAIKSLDTDIIALLDGDDRWHRNKLDVVLKSFAEDPDAMLVTHSYEVINSAGDIVKGSDQTRQNLRSIVDKAGDDKVLADILLKESILSYRGVWLGSALSFRRNCLDVEKFESWSKNMWGHSLSHQDQPLAAYLILENPGKRIYYIDQPFFEYRIFGENSSGASSSVEKANKTLARSKATLIRTKAAVAAMPSRKTEAKRQANKLLEVEYLEKLYARNYAGIIAPFSRLFFQHWSLKEKMKESSRLVGVIILGPSRFLKLK